MPRVARTVAVHYPHHVTQRGNARQNIFSDNYDYLHYRALISKYAPDYGLEIWAYCFMPNHVHFIVVPHEKESMAKTFMTCHMLYAQYVNRKRNTTGHVWQGRFFSCILDERHLYAAIRYVERNPVRAGIVSEPHEYPWSSVRGHLGLELDPLLKNPSPINDMIGDWKLFLSLPEEEELVKKVRKFTHAGIPCGDEEFIKSLSHIIPHQLARRPRGRPPKISLSPNTQGLEE